MDVLIAEDSAVYRKLLSSHLQDWGFNLTIAKDGSEAWELLQRSDCPKLALLDWVLPGIDGIELCRKIRSAGTERAYTYVILLTGKSNKEDLLEAMQAGTDDYLVKPFDEMELKARLLVGQRIIALHEQLVAARESMRHAATHDFLTGVMNRRAIMESLHRELERAKRDKKPVSVILVDIDHFKNVNDTLGHLFGDEALREVAKRLAAKLRVYDGVGRYGGEEFLLILPDCELKDALLRADDVRACIASEPITSAEVSKAVTISIGVASSTAQTGKDTESLLQHADQGLYAAKRNGRNRVEHFAEIPEKQSKKTSRPVARSAHAK
ncbi:MAG TPA: diguanylate cyclase [Terriglobales bacterium]|jgi:two-component system cell cycle response regulator|nr:diguanylate cyclase [Terriglobales bacterium]